MKTVKNPQQCQCIYCGYKFPAKGRGFNVAGQRWVRCLACFEVFSQSYAAPVKSPDANK